MYRIAIIDDCEWDIFILKLKCKRIGFHIDIQGFGVDDVERVIDDRSFDVIMTDIYFFGIPLGFDLINRLRQHCDSCDALLVAASGSDLLVAASGSESPQDQKRALDSGADLFLSKEDVRAMAAGLQTATERKALLESPIRDH